MVITYFGARFFKIQFGDIVLAFDPISKSSSLKTARFGADICLVSTNGDDYNGSEQISRNGEQSFVIKSPGEYEIKDVFIKGFLSKTNLGKIEKNNVIYQVTLEGINICFLGGINNISLDSKTKESLDDIDILFVPINDSEAISPANAYKLAVSLEAKVIIPMNFGESVNSSELKAFLKEGGKEKGDIQDKLTIKKKDLIGKEGHIIVIEPVKN